MKAQGENGIASFDGDTFEISYVASGGNPAKVLRAHIDEIGSVTLKRSGGGGHLAAHLKTGADGATTFGMKFGAVAEEDFALLYDAIAEHVPGTIDDGAANSTDASKRGAGFTAKKGCLWAVGIFVGLIVLSGVIQAVDPEATERRAEERAEREASRDTEERDQAASEAEAKIANAMEVSAVQLAGAYEQNEVAAQQQFGDRPLLVTGTVTAITLDFMDEPVVRMQGTNQFLDVSADLNDSNVAASLQQGQTIRLICQDVTEVIGSPMLRGCKIVE